MRHLWTLSVLMALPALLGAALGPEKKTDAVVVKKGANLVEVTVTGIGMKEDEALRDAQRKAVEYGAGTKIYSHSETKDFALIKDTILARAAGYVQSVQKLSSKELEDGTWEVKIKCEVSIQGIEDVWGVVTNLLQQMGRPKIMVFVNEKIDSGVVEDSTVQTNIENLLLKNGFQLVDRKQIGEIDKKDISAAIAEDKPEKVQAIAKKFGAQLYLTGSADATFAESRVDVGRTINHYGSKANIRCFRSDTGQLLASQNERENMMGKDIAKNVAADKTLAVLGKKIAPLVRDDILQFWMDVLAGRGELKMEVDGLSFKQASALEDALKKIKEVKDVNFENHNKLATFAVQSDVTAKVLAKKIAAIDGLDITDVSQNVIKATYKPEK